MDRTLNGGGCQIVGHDQHQPFFPFLFFTAPAVWLEFNLAMANSSSAYFIVWGPDESANGPIELATLISWVKNERVSADTWVFVGETGAWQKASEVAELQMLFQQRSGWQARACESSGGVEGLNPEVLRRIAILAGLTDEQLKSLVQFVEVIKVRRWTVVVRQGEREDALYLILDGKVCVRLSVWGKETVLATLEAGDFFGDLALLDRGPRSASVVADTDSTLLRISGSAFDQLAKDHVDLASSVLRALDRTLTERIRADNARFGESVRLVRQD